MVFAGDPRARGLQSGQQENTLSILEDIIAAKNGGAVRQLGSQLGLGEQQTAAALAALAPALAAGFQQNLQNPSGLDSLVSALTSGTHHEYLDNPNRLNDPAAIADGNGILKHVLGSKETSREIASRAAAQTGVSVDIMKRMLPLAAALMMGAMSRNTRGTSKAGLTAGAGGLAGMLGPLLDRNRDGSVIDDVTGVIGRVFGRS